MNDKLIRQYFHSHVLHRYENRSDVLVLDELGLCHGKVRADIAVVNGNLTGYEIKSDEDSLKRLPAQLKAYNAVFDRAILITGRKHLDNVLPLLPKWWGLIVCIQGKRGGIQFETWRKAGWNSKVDPMAVSRLLWKSEVGQILENLGEPGSMLRQPRSFLYQRLSEQIKLVELRRQVREGLKRRKNWRRPAPLSPYDD